MGSAARACCKNRNNRPGWIALGFEFVNGFHDTANAVATVF
jgi:hypothetical protein